MSAHAAAPVRRPFFTPGALVLLGLVAIGMTFAAVRFTRGISSVTHLSDQYPWGIWIAIDVATGVALAAGGFTMAALAHIFHRHRYAVVVRPALLTALLGYTFVVLGLVMDLGRYYNIWHPIVPFMWSGHSVLFEVGMCVMVYLTVLYIEFLPIVVERFAGRVALPGALRVLDTPIEAVLRLLGRTLSPILSVFIILGVVLSTLHQSSLGSLMVLARTKMSPLWWTPILPALFLLSAIAVGFAIVIFESLVAAWAFGRPPEMDVLPRLARFLPALLFIYLSFKVGDLAIRDAGRDLLDGGVRTLMLAVELGVGVVAPLLMLLAKRVRRSPSLLLAASALVIVGVVLNRIDVFLVAYTPLYAVKPYFPSIGEIAVTIGLVSALVLLYRFLVMVFPILPAEPRATAGAAQGAAALLSSVRGEG
jgi:Ni/Fe-hydrogenase subunit HybB-like protein